ncbi:MAG: TetR/AcrR family transcriptional regulator, partial [Thiovulaceae bacterium]|nr:TetR/AcrR family transcriptional regulator [Sulfurimonadaceae bacterium]
TALQLFNQHGSNNVTTNHIVEALGISPGNFYYYFKNKEEIICALFEQMIQTWDTAVQAFELPQSFEKALDMHIDLGATFYTKYLFIHKELSSLVKNDQKFESIHHDIHARRLKEFKLLLGYFIGKGELIPMSETTQDFIIDTLWIYSLFWLPYIEISGEDVCEASILKVKQHFKQLLQPYLASH